MEFEELTGLARDCFLALVTLLLLVKQVVVDDLFGLFVSQEDAVASTLRLQTKSC